MKSYAAAGFGEYVATLFAAEDSVLREVRQRAEAAGLPPIHVGPADGLHLTALARLSGARRVVEIGTLAGYSGICLARALPSDGWLYTFESESAHAEVARESFRRAGVAAKVRLVVGPALDNLRAIEADGPFDLVFIDADKENYPNYLEWAWRNLRTGGAVVGDNVFAWGYIETDAPSHYRQQVEALRAFNRALADRERWQATILPTGEGLALGVKL